MIQRNNVIEADFASLLLPSPLKIHSSLKLHLRFEELLNNNELNKLMGDILVELMQEQMKREENEQRDSKTGN